MYCVRCSSVFVKSFALPLSKVDAKSEWLRPHIRFLNGPIREREEARRNVRTQFLYVLRYIRIPVAFLLCCCWSVAIEMKRRRRPTLFAHFPSFASFDIPPTLAFFRSFASFLSLQFSIANVNMYPLPLQLLCRLPPTAPRAVSAPQSFPSLMPIVGFLLMDTTPMRCGGGYIWNSALEKN